jgi:signal transduction histidine kinase
MPTDSAPRATRRAPARTAEYLRAIDDVARATVDGADPDEVFGRIVRAARSLIGAATSILGLLDADRTHLVRRAAVGARDDVLPVGQVMPVEQTLAAGLVDTGRSLVLTGPEGAPEPYRGLLLRAGFGPAMCVPLVAGRRVFGAIVVADAPGSAPFRSAHVALVEAFAGQAAIALEFARARDELRRLAVAAERERIARDLHDGAIQALFGLGLDLQGLVSEVGAALAPRLDATVARVDEAIHRLRGHVAVLRPGVLASLTEGPDDPAGADVRVAPAGGPARPPPGRAGRDAWGRHGFARRLRAVGELNRAIVDGVDVDAVCGRLAASARTMVDAESAVVGTLRGPDPDALVLRATDGPHAERFRPGDLYPVDGTVLGEAVRTGQPVVVADLQRDAGAPRRTRQLGFGAAVAVPLAARGRVFGALAVGRQAGRPPFTPGDARLLETFAGQAALALEYGRARDELGRLAVLDERQRIARALHEGVIQTLFGAGLDLQALAAALDDPITAGRLARAVEGIDGVIRDLRNHVFGLRPGILADRQLDRALRELGDDFARRTGIAPTIEIDAAVAARLGGAAAADVVQIAREALANVARHAQAGACRLTLRPETGRAVLEVADDGRGLPPAAEGSGRGLGNVRARAAVLGGAVAFGEGLAGRGTLVRVALPL